MVVYLTERQSAYNLFDARLHSWMVKTAITCIYWSAMGKFLLRITNQYISVDSNVLFVFICIHYRIHFNSWLAQIKAGINWKETLLYDDILWIGVKGIYNYAKDALKHFRVILTQSNSCFSNCIAHTHTHPYLHNAETHYTRIYTWKSLHHVLII